MTGLSKDGKVWVENLGLSSEALPPWGTSSSVGTARAHSQGPASQAASYRPEGRAASTQHLLPSPQSRTKQGHHGLRLLSLAVYCRRNESATSR